MPHNVAYVISPATKASVPHRERLMPLPANTLRPQITPPLPDSTPLRILKRRNKDIFVILTFAASCMAAMLCLLPAVGHDQLWCLYVAQRLLHGTKIYGPEILESNPPLIMAMLLLPAKLASLTALPITALFKLGVLLLETASAIASLKLLRRLNPAITPAQLWALAFAFVTIFAALPARDFGQRDHLLAILCIPYVLAAALDATPAAFRLNLPARLAIGITAGIGLSLKPHHLLVPIAIEAVLLFKIRRLRAEPVAILATCLTYLAAIRLITPQYITDILPILRDTYWAIGHLTFPQLITAAIELHILAALTITLYLQQRRHSPSPAIVFFLLAGAASTLAYYLQGTGWYYQQIPALSFFACALALLLTQLAHRKNMTAPRWSHTGIAALSILAIALTAHFSGYTLTQPLTFPDGLSNIPDPAFFTTLTPGTPVAILTTVVDDSVPPIRTHNLLWAQRENNLWTLPAILRNEAAPNSIATAPPSHRLSPTRLAELSRLQHLWMVEDLTRWHPPLVLVLRCQDPAVSCQILEDRHDDLLAWFSRDPAFREIWQHYHLLRSSGPYDAYQLVP